MKLEKTVVEPRWRWRDLACQSLSPIFLTLAGLQRRQAALGDRLRDAGGPAGRTPRPDSRGARSQAGGSSRAASDAGSRSLIERVKIFAPGEMEAGSAGKQPCRGIARRAHRDDDSRARGSTLAPAPHIIGSKDPDALRKSPPAGRSSTLPRNVGSPVPAEPGQGSHLRLTRTAQGTHHITIPQHKALRMGTLNVVLGEIASHRGISKAELLDQIQ